MAMAHHIAGPLDGEVRTFGPSSYEIPEGYREIGRSVTLPELSIWADEDELFLCHTSVYSYGMEGDDAVLATHLADYKAKHPDH